MAAMAASLSRATFFGTGSALTAPCKQRVCGHTGALGHAAATAGSHLWAPPAGGGGSRPALSPPKMMGRPVCACTVRRSGGRRSYLFCGSGGRAQRRGGAAQQTC